LPHSRLSLDVAQARLGQALCSGTGFGRPSCFPCFLAYLNSYSETMSPSNTGHPEQFDVFLSYSHLDAKWVEDLAVRLEDEGGFRVWLDKWILGPGKSWQQEMARGLDQAKSSAVCISEHTPDGWFKKEIEKALNRQTKDPSFRVIPVLLPNAKTENVDDFLELNTWVDFRGPDFAYAFHRLVYGVKGLPPGRWPPK
jgi:hypothetical protein